MSSPQEPIRPSSTEPAPSQGMVFAALDNAATLDSDAVANTGAIMAEEERADTALLARLAAKRRARRLRFGILAALIVIGLGFVLTRQGQTNKPLADSKLDASQRYNETSVSLGGLDIGPAASAQGVETLSVNGQLNVNDSLVLNPQEQPLNAVTGQLYYDKSTGRLAYYDGKAFVNVLSSQSNAIVQGVGGLSGNIGVGSGLAAANGALSNTGVLSLQGQSGNVVFTSGSGIDVHGTTVSNTGVLSIAGQTGDITVGNGLAVVGSQLHNSGLLTATAGTNIAITNDGSGNITISATGSAGGGTGGSGTGGTLALWDGSGTVNNLTSSILSQSGGTVTVAGNLSAASLSGNGSGVTNVNAAQLGGQAGSYYTDAGNLSSGTLNDSRLSSNAALYNNTTSNFTGTSLQHNGNNVCDTSGNCVGVAGGGIGGSGTAGTVAMFTNGGFTIGDSLLSQDVGATTISVAGNLSASGTVSAASLTGNGSGVTNVNAVQLGGQAGSYYTNAGNLSSGTLNDSRLSSNAALYNNSTSNFTGNLQQNGDAVCTTAGNCTGVAGGSIGGSGTLNKIALFTGSGYTIGNSLLSQDAGATTITLTGSLNVSSAVVATSFSGGGSGLTGVNAAQLEGNTASYYTNAGNLSSGTLNDARLSANAALYNNATSNFTGTLQHNGNDVCDTSGNCSGTSGVSGSGTTHTIALFSGTQTIGDSLLTQDDGTTTINVAGNLTATGTVTAANLSGNGAGVTSVNAAQLSGQNASYYTDASNLSAGTLSDARLSANAALYNNTTSNFTGSLQQNGADVCTTAGNCSGTSGGGIGGGGTANKIALITNGGYTIGDSLLSQDAGATTVSVTGDLTASGNVSGTKLYQNGNQVCDTSGNCAGTGGGVTTSGGTANKFTIFTGTQTIGNSILSQDAGATTVSVTGDLSVSGGVTATSLSGDGSGVTNVNAAQLGGQAGSYYTNAGNLSSGTLNNARLSNSVTLQGNTFNGVNQLVQLTGSGLLPVLDGSLLTNLNASNIASGTLNDARLSANAALYNNTTSNFTGALQQAGNDVCTTAGNCLGSGGGVGGSGTANTIAMFNGSGFTIGNSLLTQDAGATTVSIAGNLTATGTVSAASLSGNGSGVTNVNAAQLGGQAGSYYTNAGNLSSGTLNDSRLSSNAALYNNTTSNFTGTSLQHNGNNVCDASGNCVGVAGGGIGGSGTAGTIALFTGTGYTVGDSILSQSGTTVTVAGTLAATSLQGDGSAITALNASNLTSGIVASGRLSGAYTGITGTGALTSGSIGGSFGVISTGSAISTIDALTGNTVNSMSGYFANGTAGSTTTCSGGQFLQNQVIQGGIVTGGTCGTPTGDGTGITTVGTFSTTNTAAGGATISGATITFQSASINAPGMVDTTTQSFAGDKTFTGNAAIQGTLGVTGSTSLLGDLSANGNITLGSIRTYALGDVGPGGGKIFYDKGNNSDGWRYLEAAPSGWNGGSDPLAAWCSNASTLIGASGTAIGTGKTNTATMLANCSSGAANKAAAYTGGGYNDWFLPSNDEISQLDANRSSVGGFTSGIYWSSSEYKDIWGWFDNFNGSYQNGDTKSASHYVRPIREVADPTSTISLNGMTTANGNVSVNGTSNFGGDVTVASGKTLNVGSITSYQTIVPTGTFAAKVDGTTGAAPWAIAKGDFNGDGKVDLVTANNSGNSVSVLLGNGDGTFQAKVDYAAGSGPRSVAASDFNGDGKVDLAVVNYGANTVSILLGNGDGTFQAKVDYATGSSPQSIAIGDFNGDGKTDMAIPNYSSSTVSVLLGNGNGTFQAKVDYATGSGPSYVTTADFNGDSKADLAVVNLSATTVSVLLGNGNGTFQTKVDYATGSSPLTVTASDFNGDGKVDLAVANLSSNSVSVLLGNGDGTFQAKVDYATGSGPRSVTASDFNGDGKVDLAVTNFGANSVSILLGNGNGTFQAKVDYATGSLPYSVIAGDFNGDGNADLAVANNGGGTMSVLLANTTLATTNGGISLTTASGSQAGIIIQGSLGQTADLVHVQDSTGASLFTVNSGGVATAKGIFSTGNISASGIISAPTVQASTFDTAAAGTLSIGSTNATSISLNQNTVVASGKTISVGSAASYQKPAGAGTFQAKVDYATGASEYSVASGDFNGDGKMDLATAGYGNNTVSIFKGNGDGTFQAKTDITVGNHPSSIVTADFNGDGKIDLAVANYSVNNVAILLGNGDGTFQLPLTRTYSTGGGSRSLVAGDFNEDGKVDLAVANYSNSTVSVLLGNGDGTFATSVDYAIGSTSAWSIVTSDFNGDGKQDLAVANNGNNTVSVLLGNGDGTFQPKLDTAVGSGPRHLTTGDFNGDGKTDIAVANASSGTVSVLLGNGDGTFQPKLDTTVGSSSSVTSITTSDFNGDGKQDLAVGAWSPTAAYILLGNGDGTFQVTGSTTTGSRPEYLLSIDLNNDGSIDLVSANDTASNISVVLGTVSSITVKAGISLTTASGIQAGIILQGSSGQTADLLHLQSSAGAALFTVSGSGVVSAGSFLQNGHTVCDSSGNCPAGVSVIGALDGGTANANGATISGNTIYLQSASATNPGMVNIVAQTFKGAKTFNDLVTASGGLTATGTTNINTSGTAATTIGNASYSSTTNINSYNVNIGQQAFTSSCNSFFGFCSTTIAGYMVGQYPKIVLYNDQSDSNIQVTGSTRISGGDDMGFGALLVQNTTSNATNPIEILKQGTTPTSTSDALQIQNSSGTALGGFNYQGNLYYKNGSFTSTVNTATLTANQTITLPNATGTVALTNDTTNFIRNQTSQQTSANFNIDGTGVANTLQASTFDTASAGALSIGTTHATSINLAQNTTVASGKTISVGTSTSYQTVVATGTFVAKVDYTTGAQPYSVATGDFNGDGKADLVTANYTPGTVSVLLGNGNGTFQTAVTYPTGTSPYSVTARDFNGDGKLDLAVADSGSNKVSILIGNGDGTFQSKVDYTTGTLPVYVTSGDFNGDGKTDLAVANRDDNTVSILLGNGDGTFGAKTDFTTALIPYAITTRDFNGDGKLDLAVSTDSSAVSVLLGNGDGTFQTKVDYAMGAYSDSITSGDFNGDGKFDLAVPDFGSGLVSVFLGNGNGTFQTKVDYTTGSSPRSITTGDFNGDGGPDLAVANYGSVSTSVFLANTTTVNRSAGISMTTASGTQAGIIIQGSAGQNADLLHIQDSAGAALFTLSASGVINTGNVFSTGNISATGIMLASTMQASTFDTAAAGTLGLGSTNATSITFGNTASGNYITFTAAGGLVANGTARHTKTINRTAEYAGAVLDVQQDATCTSSSNGTMTSGYDSTGMSYYNWAGNDTTQCYDVVERITLPADFAGWAGSTPLSLKTYTSDNTTGLAQIDLRDTTNTGVASCAYVSATPGTNGTWANTASGCTFTGGTYTAGGVITIRIRMTASTSSTVRIGDLSLSYYSKF